jgi:PKHD-type hydroxylase
LSDDLGRISKIARLMNDQNFGYDLNDGITAWLQTYETGDAYALHRDGELGQSRKLTAVAMLSHPNEYLDGELLLYIHPYKFVVPKTQGTVVIFPPWVLHEVTPVTGGLRQTINMAFWGPTFR